MELRGVNARNGYEVRKSTTRDLTLWGSYASENHFDGGGSRAERVLLMIRTIATQRVQFVCTANDLSAHTTIFRLFEATLSFRIRGNARPRSLALLRVAAISQ